MPSKFVEDTSRNSILPSGISDEARKAANAVFEAISTWRTETINNNEKNLDRVIDKMAAAAQALGWPEQITEAARTQMETITKLQVQTMDQMMDAWGEQMKSPSSSSAILSRLKSFPNVSAAGIWPNFSTSQMAAFNPFGIYMQFAQQWQKACADTMAFWSKAGESNSWRAKL